MKQILIEKLILFLLCAVPTADDGPTATLIGAMLTAAILAALAAALGQRALGGILLFYALLCAVSPPSLSFLPLFVYDAASFSLGKRPAPVKYLLPPLLLLLPLLLHLPRLHPLLIAQLGLLSVLALWMRRRETERELLRRRFFSYRDQTVEQSQLLERRQRELISRQDYEIELATLNERTRIAREIHDNVGHLLTRALLQVKALQVVHRQQPQLEEALGLLGETLGDAMDSIRSSVHDLRDNALNLKISLQSLIDGFTFCPVTLDYEAGPLPKSVAYCFLAICREALSNIAKHSGASRASVCVVEHPAFYQLIIQDGGSSKQEGTPLYRLPPAADGIGLLNMQERVESLGGNFRLSTEKGFSIFVSVPKTDDES